ncbi:MAG: helix-turn-helix domain-containing protein [Opitutales bacterium]|jgi:hypothetical protein
MIYKTLAENIKYFRKLKSLSQLDLAAMAKINIKTISRAESGKQGVKLEIIYKISNALNIDFYKLFMPRTYNIDDEADIKTLITNKLELLNKNRLFALNKMMDVIEEIK